MLYIFSVLHLWEGTDLGGRSIALVIGAGEGG